MLHGTGKKNWLVYSGKYSGSEYLGDTLFAFASCSVGGVGHLNITRSSSFNCKKPKS